MLRAARGGWLVGSGAMLTMTDMKVDRFCDVKDPEAVGISWQVRARPSRSRA